MSVKWALVIDVDACTGCGACAVACRLENNVAKGQGPGRSLDWLRLDRADNAKPFPLAQQAVLPRMCQHCEKPPCVSLCPVGALKKSTQGGIVTLVYARCIGCRACLAVCPYQALTFNRTDPAWPGDTARAVTPYASLRGRGVAEKCTLCAHMLAEGRQAYVPACVRACPSRAMVFGDAADPQSEAAKRIADPRAFRLPPHPTGLRLTPVDDPAPQVYYLSARDWLRSLNGQAGR